MNADAKERLVDHMAAMVLAEREACAVLAGNIRVDADCEGKELLAAFLAKWEQHGDPAKAFAECVDLVVEYTGASIAGAIRMRRRP